MTSSHWRQRARQTIDAAHATALANGVTDRDGIMVVVDAAYPFGERAMHPYTCWLRERREFMERQGWRAKPVVSAARHKQLVKLYGADYVGSLFPAAGAPDHEGAL